MRFLALVAVTVVATGATAAGIVAAGGGEVAREALGAKDNPGGGKGRTLGLSKVTIPAGAQISLHHHSGTQVAHIAAGVLTYTVKSGQVPVMRGAADGTPTLVRRIAAGETGSIRAGEWIVEEPTTVHRAASRTSRPVVINLSTLFPIGSPPSIPVK